MEPRRLLLATVVSAACAAVGCGGSPDKTAEPRPPASAERPPPRLERGDRTAFAALSAGSGALRAAAVPVAYGSAPRIVSRRPLRVAARRVGRTHPRARALRGLRARLLAALRRAGSSPDGTARQVARESIGAADRVDAGLRRYAAANPAANELLPGSGG